MVRECAEKVQGMCREGSGNVQRRSWKGQGRGMDSEKDKLQKRSREAKN
jgi:hypothetical protein